MKTIIEKSTCKTVREKNAEKVYLKKCWNCKSKFTYQREDVTREYDLDEWTRCPVCDCDNNLFIKRRYRK